MTKRTLGLNDSIYNYLLANSLRESEVLRQLREETAKHEWAIMQISPEQGQFMALLVEMLGVRRAIEVGVFTGYSALSVALAMPDDGKIVACDINPDWTNVAKRYWKKAGVEHKIDLRLAPARDTLLTLVEQGNGGSFDFAFIDADKANYEAYYELCLELIRPGGVIAVDNVLWGGSVADANVKDSDTQSIRRFNEKLHRDDRVSISLVPIADGLTLARKR